MQDTFQIQQFLRFRRQNPDWLQKVKKQRVQQKTEQKEITKLVTRNNNKKKQLELIKKQFQKIKKNSEQVLYEMKNQQDALDKKIESIQKKKMQQFRKTVVAQQKVQHLKQQIERLKQDFQTKQFSSQTEIKSLQNEISEFTKMVSDIKDRISTNQEWLNNLQSNRSNIQPVNIYQVQTQVLSLKKNNEILQKQVIQQQKRLRREADQIKKSYKDFCQKIQDRIKAWVKKCDPVIQEKKQIKTLLQGINQTTYIQDLSEIQLLYKSDLQNMSSSFEGQLQKQLGEFFNPFILKCQGISVQKATQKYFSQDIDQQIGRIRGEINNYNSQMQQHDEDIQHFKQKIDKSNKVIQSTKQRINILKRQH